jgi:hypothetical protein
MFMLWVIAMFMPRQEELVPRSAARFGAGGERACSRAATTLHSLTVIHFVTTIVPHVIPMSTLS